MMKSNAIISLKILVLSVSLFYPTHLSAQEARRWEALFFELNNDEESETSSLENTFEVLCDLEEHPVNLNTATREDLEQLSFLSASQIEDILEHVHRYGSMKSTNELALIESLDHQRLALLMFFVYAGEPAKRDFPKLKNVFQYGKQELLLTAKFPFYERRGDHGGYLGSRYSHSFHYTFRFADYVKAGLTGAKDSGEPFFNRYNKWGYDHYSFYVQLKNMGVLKTLVVGRYRLKFGMGLAMNNDFSFGKQVTLSSLGRPDHVVRAHSSKSSSNYLQGAAATIRLGNGLDATTFVSWRKIDATLDGEDGTIATLLKTGYHRTESEWLRKNNVAQTLLGANVVYKKNRFHAGMTGFYTSFSRMLRPEISRRYKEIYPSGNHFFNFSVDYGYRTQQLTLSGETAVGKGGGLATLNTLSYQPTGALTLMLLHRFYSYRYQSLFSESFSDGGYVRNESGLFAGLTWRPSYQFLLTAYTDYAYFPWMRYQVSATSHGWDNFVQASWQLRRWQLTGRYRLRIRQRDNLEKTALSTYREHRARLAVSYQRSIWEARTQVDFSASDLKQKSMGYMVSQNFGVNFSEKIQASAFLGYFNTDDYDSRVYSYERSPLYSFSFPVFYGEGIRYGLFCRADFGRKWMFIMRLSTSNYFDRSSISSGLQQIDQSHATDLDLQLRWKF